jgi:hypothetical protein
MTLAHTDQRPIPKASCDRCRSVRHVIEGDGLAVCFPCIELLTNAAADPLSISAELRDVLSEIHADIVRLGDIDGGVQAWEWQGWK